MGTCGFCQPDQGLNYGQYPIPISPSVPGQASFVVPPPIDRTTQSSNPALTTLPTGGLQTSQFGGYGGPAGAGIHSSVYGAPGQLGSGLGTNSGIYGQQNPALGHFGQSGQFGQQPPFGGPNRGPGGPFPGGAPLGQPGFGNVNQSFQNPGARPGNFGGAPQPGFPRAF